VSTCLFSVFSSRDALAHLLLYLSIGNIMAGSEHYGFFIEGHRKIRGPSRYQDPDLRPMTTTPTTFKDNTIHGHKGEPFRV